MKSRRKSSSTAASSMSTAWAPTAIAILLLMVTVAAYWQVSRNDFVFYDDSRFIIDNPFVRAGLTWQGLKWACVEIYTDYWHPLTWLSMMLDIQLFGLRAGSHHLVNLAIHVANTLLLFWFLRYVSGRLWLSAFVAAVFALHPLHVESVAWAAERKDTLSTMFWFATLLAYAWYAKQPSGRRYAVVVLLFTLGLLSKPMLVTLPVVLLILDYWPLERFEFAGWKPQGTEGISFTRLLLEKLPLLLMAACVAAITVIGQSSTAMPSTEALDPATRLCNATISYGNYIVQMFWPSGLAPFYPLPREPMYAWAAVSAACLAVMTAAAMFPARSRKYLLAGWLWYIVTLLPVIGIVQSGSQAHADRYTYIPLIGVCIMLAWGTSELLLHRAVLKPIVAAVAVIWIGAMAGMTWRQVQYWQNSETLVKHTMAVSKDTCTWRANWANILSDRGENTEAIAILRRLVQDCADRDRVDAFNSLGSVLARAGKLEEALECYRNAAALQPNNARSWFNVGTVLVILNRPQEAIEPLRKAMQIDSSYAKAHMGLGLAIGASGDIPGSIVELKKAIELDPYLAPAYLSLGRAYAAQGNWMGAADQYKKSLAIQQDYPALSELGWAQENLGDLAGAETSYRSAVALQPNNAVAHYNLGAVMARLGRKDQARQELQKALSLDQNLTDARLLLGSL